MNVQTWQGPERIRALPSRVFKTQSESVRAKMLGAMKLGVMKFRRCTSSDAFVEGNRLTKTSDRLSHMTAFAVLLCLALNFSAVSLSAADPKPKNSLETVQKHIAAGEFSAARRLSQSLPQQQRDLAMGMIAKELAVTGQTTAAINDLQSISNPAIGQSAAASMLGRFPSRPLQFQTTSNGIDSGASGYNSGAHDYASPDNFGGAPNPGGLGGAMGGGSLADFSSLMTLIQTTIAPDQWEALGGPSTMFPYPAGIYVDPSGLVRDVNVQQADRLVALNSLADRLRSNHRATEGDQAKTNSDWTAPSSLRTVSLKRLRFTYLHLVATGQPIPAAVQNLAGLTEIRYVIIEDHDILLAGPVGGINPGAAPWPQDLGNHKTTLGFDLLVTSANAVLNQAAYGCTIDPTPEGMRAAADVSRKISNRDVAPALAADALATAMGKQNIVLFDIPADQPLAWLLVDADRHMKQLALGQHPMPNGVLNYLDVVEQAAKDAANQAVPSGQLLRMWFAVNPKQIQQATNGPTFELDGLPLKLITAKEFADGNGGRVQAGEDQLGEEFAKGFNKHFDSIAAMYPVYDRLRGAFELTAALQLVKTQVGQETFARLLGELAHPDLVLDQTVSVPTQCDSLAVRHTIRTPTKRHEIYIVSGGVKVDPANALISHITKYPVLDTLNVQSEDAPTQNTRWWWDR